jgi:predicted ferric reductase
MSKEMAPPTNSNPAKLKLYRVLTIGFLLIVICGALSIPFVYKSQTLWYKIGIDKTMLLGGQLAGLFAAVLLLVQILLAVRGQFLKEVFGIAALMRWHRTNGIIVSLLAISHVVLILVPEGLTNFPIGLKYWPEMVGSLLFWIILSMAISSQFREKLGLDYKRWKTIHKLLGYLVIIFLAVHVLFVSDSFEQTVPRVAFMTTLIGVVVAVIASKQVTGQAKS